MIPIKDNIPSSITPVVNYALIGACTLAFLGQLAGESGVLIERYGMIPARISDPAEPVYVTEQVAVRTQFGVRLHEQQRPAAEPPFSPWFTLLTCIFLHGGWMHFLGNVWFLYIFGDNVEDRLGHWGYLAFYLLSGVAASAAHLGTNWSSTVPTIGASGAIAGVMGAYFLLHPKAMVLTVVPIFFFIEVLVLPAYFFLGIWFLLQFFQGTMAITATEAGGVAWWAHIGGFVAGLGAAAALRHAGLLRRQKVGVMPMTDHIGHYRYRPRRY